MGKDMKITYKAITELKPYAGNPRHNTEAVKAVANSIQEFGFRNPIIIDKDNVIIAGHTRLRAAERLQLETVPTIMAEDLTEEQVKAFRLADNKLAELSSWDYELLREELEAITMDMQAFGFQANSGETPRKTKDSYDIVVKLSDHKGLERTISNMKDKGVRVEQYFCERIEDLQ